MMGGWLTVWVISNMTCILLLTTGSCGNDEQDRTGSTLSDMLWINHNAMYQEIEDCSDRERFFYSSVFPSGFCNNGQKMIYKQRKYRHPVRCVPGYVLREKECVKECVAVQSVKGKPADLTNSTLNSTNTTGEGGTDLEHLGGNVTTETIERGIDLGNTGGNVTTETIERGIDLGNTGGNVTTETIERGIDLGNAGENGTNTTEESRTDIGTTGANGSITTTEKDIYPDQTGVIDTSPATDAMEREECVSGCYGKFCQFNCLCEHNSTCDKLKGQCTCRDGWTGINCEKECPRGTYGFGCSQTCNCDVTSCHPIDGCICRSPGQNCNIVCPGMTFGTGCSGQCLCYDKGTQECGVLDGSCTCRPGWTGMLCDQLCPFGHYGEGCRQTCECESDEFCNPTNGVCLCWNITTGLNCHKDKTTDPPPIAFPQTLLHILILVGGALLLLIAVVCTIVAWRRKGSHSKNEYKFNSKDSTLKIDAEAISSLEKLHADLPPREDLSGYREESDSNRRTQSCRSKRKSHQDGATRQAGVLNLPSRVTSKPPSTVLGFQQYSPTQEGSVDFDEITRHSYVNLKDEDISKHVQGDGNDYERLNRDDIKSQFQDYEVCVKSDVPYENVPAKKRSILGSLRKLVRKESHPDSDKVHLAEDTSAGISRTSFVTFNKRHS